MTANRILQCFLNVDMRNGHDGLAEIAKQNGIKTNQIETGNYLVFINSSKTKLKLYAANNVIAYLRAPAGTQIDLRVIKELPRVFNGKQIDYDKALKTTIEEAMLKKRSAIFGALSI